MAMSSWAALNSRKGAYELNSFEKRGSSGLKPLGVAVSSLLFVDLNQPTFPSIPSKRRPNVDIRINYQGAPWLQALMAGLLC